MSAGLTDAEREQMAGVIWDYAGPNNISFRDLVVTVIAATESILAGRAQSHAETIAADQERAVFDLACDCAPQIRGAHHSDCRAVSEGWADVRRAALTSAPTSLSKDRCASCRGAHPADLDHCICEQWPCANYLRPVTCLTAPSSVTGRCDWCTEALATARAEALRDAAGRLSGLTEGDAREGTDLWPESDRNIYSLAIEEAQSALRVEADREASDV